MSLKLSGQSTYFYQIQSSLSAIASNTTVAFFHFPLKITCPGKRVCFLDQMLQISASNVSGKVACSIYRKYSSNVSLRRQTQIVIPKANNYFVIKSLQILPNCQLVNTDIWQSPSFYSYPISYPRMRIAHSFSF